MKHLTSRLSARAVIFIAAVTLCGCSLFSPAISSFDQYAYVQTTSQKVDALNIMDSAVEEYSLHAKSVIGVQTNLQKLYEYQKNRPKNEITVKQLTILMDSTANLFGGFIARWRNERKLGKAFIRESKKQVGEAFDQIAVLESKKRR